MHNNVSWRDRISYILRNSNHVIKYKFCASRSTVWNLSSTPFRTCFICRFVFAVWKWGAKMTEKTRQLFVNNFQKFRKFTVSLTSGFGDIKEVWYKDWNINRASQGMLLLINREIPDQSTQYFFWLFFFFKNFRATFFFNSDG